MVKRLLLASTLLCSAPVVAQSFPQPTDVQPFNQVAPTFNTTGGANYPLDETVAPMSVTPLTNIPIPSTTNRIGSDGPYTPDPQGVGTPFCTTIPFGGTCTENKLRLIVGFSHMLPDDPERNFGQSGRSHLHCFAGAGSTNANSTYKTLRQHALDSRASGTDANGTAYWEPCIVLLNPYGDGKNFALRENFHVVYYTENPATDGTGYGIKSEIKVGKRYVSGFDMDSAHPAVSVVGTDGGQYAWYRSYLDAANSASGHNRYQLTDSSGHLLTQAQYSCVGATPSVTYVLKNADGSDPFGGTCEYAAFNASASGSTLSVNSMISGTIQAGELIDYDAGNGIQVSIQPFGTSGTTGAGTTGTYALSTSLGTVPLQAMRAFQDFFVNITASNCDDGANLWSPGGYKNMIPPAWDNDNSRWVCPINYYHVGALTQEIHVTQYGWADRQRWDLSSDIAYRASHSLTAAQLPPGTTGHVDWEYGWDRTIFLAAQQHCIGIDHNTGHECNSSQYDNSHYLIGGYAGEGGVIRTVQVDETNQPHWNESDKGWMQIPSAWSSSITGMRMCGNAPETHSCP